MEHPVRVALLATAVDFGGIDRVVANLVTHSDARVELLPVLFTRSDTTRHQLFDILTAHDVRFDKILIDARTHRWPTPLRDLRRTIARVRNRNVDLIHSHGYRADVLGYCAARWLGAPIVSTCHGYISNGRLLNLYNRLDLAVLKHFDRVIAVSGPLRADLVSHGIHPDKVETLVNAVAEDRRADAHQVRRTTRAQVGLRDDDVVFGFVGRLGPEKGLMYLLEAVTRVAGAGQKIRLLVVGDGPQRSLLEGAADAAGLGEAVVFAGFQDDPGAWYPAMDVFVLPSLTEGTPMVLLEAMSSGLPVVASSVGGIPAMVAHGASGLLVPPADVLALSQAMHALAVDGALRSALGERARAVVRARFDVRAWARSMAEIYARVVADKAQAPKPAGRSGAPTTTGR